MFFSSSKKFCKTTDGVRFYWTKYFEWNKLLSTCRQGEKKIVKLPFNRRYNRHDGSEARQWWAIKFLPTFVANQRREKPELVRSLSFSNTTTVSVAFNDRYIMLKYPVSSTIGSLASGKLPCNHSTISLLSNPSPPIGKCLYPCIHMMDDPSGSQRTCDLVSDGCRTHRPKLDAHYDRFLSLSPLWSHQWDELFTFLLLNTTFLWALQRSRICD